MSVMHTLAQACMHVAEVRKSRFIAHASPIGSPADALAFFADVGDAAATHNCWAYRVGTQYRSSDDGEPAGTAGRPILQAIDAREFDRVAVVVTRWFGGIKLGAGGLARAYGGCAAECLRLAPRVPIVAHVDLKASCDFGALAILRARFATIGAECLEIDSVAGGARVHLRVAADRIDAVRDLVREVTRGRGRVDATDPGAA